MEDLDGAKRLQQKAQNDYSNMDMLNARMEVEKSYLREELLQCQQQRDDLKLALEASRAAAVAEKQDLLDRLARQIEESALSQSQALAAHEALDKSTATKIASLEAVGRTDQETIAALRSQLQVLKETNSTLKSTNTEYKTALEERASMVRPSSLDQSLRAVRENSTPVAAVTPSAAANVNQDTSTPAPVSSTPVADDATPIPPAATEGGDEDTNGIELEKRESIDAFSKRRPSLVADLYTQPPSSFIIISPHLILSLSLQVPRSSGGCR
jgi:nitrogen fixation/metabolism regulation signal transduction histidine kinase